MPSDAMDPSSTSPQTLPPLPPLDIVAATRGVLHELAEHTMAAEQYAANQELALEVLADGFATGWFPADDTQARWRVQGLDLIRETRAGERQVTSLAERVDAAAVAALYAWWWAGRTVLDGLSAAPGEELSPVILWPEHFDVATTLTLADGRHLNLGFSPGDEFSPAPYVYAGPWESFAGPFWNASFGAFRTYPELTERDAEAGAAEFLRTARQEYLAAPGQQ
jgi:hypothetical protein